jgi:hypothetical protein
MSLRRVLSVAQRARLGHGPRRARSMAAPCTHGAAMRLRGLALCAAIAGDFRGHAVSIRYGRCGSITDAMRQSFPGVAGL